MAGSIASHVTRNSSSDNISSFSSSVSNSPSQGPSTLPTHEQMQYHLLPPMDDEKTRVFAFMAFDLLVMGAQLHPEQTEFACPSYDCKDSFPTARELVHHIPFCQNFSSQKAFCNVCKSKECFTVYRSSASKKGGLSRMTRKIFHRLSVSGPSARQVSYHEDAAHLMRPADAPKQETVAVSPSPSFQSEEISLSIQVADDVQLSELSAIRFEPPELHGRLIPQELPTTLVADLGMQESFFSPRLSVETGAEPMVLENEPLFASPVESSEMLKWGELRESVGELPPTSFAESEIPLSRMFASADSQLAPTNSSPRILTWVAHNLTDFPANGDLPSPASLPFNDTVEYGTDFTGQAFTSLHASDASYQDNFEQIQDQANTALCHHSNHTLTQSCFDSTRSCTFVTSQSPSSIAPSMLELQTPAYSPSTDVGEGVIPHSSLVLGCNYPDCSYVTGGEKVASYPTYLRKHKKIHEKTEFSCPDCGKTFTRKDNMEAHKQKSCHRNVCARGISSSEAPREMDEDLPTLPGATRHRQRRRAKVLSQSARGPRRATN